MTNIIMLGCNGRMGQMITDIVAKDDEAQIVAGIDIVNNRENPYPVFTDIKDCDVKADAIIDFSSANGFEERMDYAVDKQIPIIVCSTGLSDEQLDYLKEASKKLAVLKSANMSLGVNLLIKLVKEAAKKLATEGFDVEIVEKHHNQKLDAPSGTALALADSINDEMGGQYEYVYDRSKVRQKRDKKELGISAVRGGTIVGEHDVIFAGTDEVVTFSHTAYSRAVFGKGAVEAAKYISETYHCAVLCKGGHQLNDANDLLYRDGGYKWFNGKRIDNPNTHGTGCTLSSAIASNLAKGYDLDTAVERAKAYISGALAAMLDLGHGSGPMDHGFDFRGKGFAEEKA